ncbi:ExbD/TolR family protein [Veronia pacifica]|uniref:Biopolymer transporter ExbD n=1 Tax=Veronia pacifica TaxID=1080227 RepID=A0A1C3EE92_9GAMM|nr:biopolymer transporter ExbD [Veronia pacifica]ODA31543.1 biopolymer transporter ExbD [Veronia pacifica]
MRLTRVRKAREEAQIDLTSMMDIVFIMLIFFIVSSSFVSETGVDINRPTASQATAQQAKGIAVAITSDNEIYIDNQFVDVERLEEKLAFLLMDKPEAGLLIQADKRAFNGTVVNVMDIARRVGIQKIALSAEKR